MVPSTLQAQARRVCSFWTEGFMEDTTLIGIDLGKHSFNVHGEGRHGKALLRKKFSRKQLIEFFAKFHTCTVVMEVCASAHRERGDLRSEVIPLTAPGRTLPLRPA